MRQADLYSGTSYWRVEDGPPPDFPRVEGPQTCGVVVVGAGITGALVAYQLSKSGEDVILLDKEWIGEGSTSASTGLLQYEVDTPLVDLIATLGEASAVHAYRRGLRAIDELEEVIEALGVACGFSRRSSLCLASQGEDVGRLRQEDSCRRHFGFQTTYLNRSGLRDFAGIAAPGALLAAGNGQVDPYACTQALVVAGKRQGVRAFQHSPVLSVEERPGGVTVVTSGGPIVAAQAVLATGYAGQPQLAPPRTTLSSTYAVVSQILPAGRSWPGGCLIWETARPYSYARQTPDGRALIGGGDTPGLSDHFDSTLLEKKAIDLRRRFEQMFPAIEFLPACAWGGIFAETDDGLPFIGRVPGRERVFAALGYGGNGITFGVIAARLIAAVRGRWPAPRRPPAAAWLPQVFLLKLIMRCATPRWLATMTALSPTTAPCRPR